MQRGQYFCETSKNRVDTFTVQGNAGQELLNELNMNFETN